MNVIFFFLFFFNVQSSIFCLVMDIRTNELRNKVEEFLSGLGLKSSARPTTEKSRLITDLSNPPLVLMFSPSEPPKVRYWMDLVTSIYELTYKVIGQMGKLILLRAH